MIEVVLPSLEKQLPEPIASNEIVDNAIQHWVQNYNNIPHFDLPLKPGTSGHYTPQEMYDLGPAYRKFHQQMFKFAETTNRLRSH
ncbi:hypothetical protein TVAGG3_0101490 [Trichomonas vaginalis G3]|uniref:hypothetical protein n=1 Tax=Trichomonas vaginalis (strain ATCC PRA-98 / G3) TaxID=412133 RepID=UPI0021E5A39F|nr:hypothetical protein TVAGG3_0101490 [Trichomonas vaginalis G3]KAI5544403.1 hypothetical protein TVAGG3_0101490 [Trichomonas vaginalis G3]